ncbi:fibrobacter succinogenes major paralogous domain-containing protein [Flavobacteriales bacterium]|nr:fibrobacter succinogenes major paralogous domain-containing protein [Flavobacteriales bacterium]
MNRFFTLFLAASCLTAVGQYQVGDVGPAGGWIFYVDSDSVFDGWDYLEVAPNVSCCFQGSGCVWPPSPYSTSTELGSGLENTSQWPDGDPERISTWDFAQAYSFGGYSDWFIPSKDELDVFLESSVKYNVLAEGEGYGISTSSHYSNCLWWSWSTNIGWNIGDEGWVGNKLILPIRRFTTSEDNLLCDGGTIWDVAQQKCVFDQSACGQGTIWDAASQTCIPDNPSDLNHDGCVDVNDFMGHLAAFGSGCEEGVAETPWQCGDPLEYQGYNYETVQIGEQCWFAENLRSENYESGDAIASNLADPEWSATTLGATAVYGEGSSQCFTESPDGDACNEYWALEEYGRLYNWYAVDDGRGLCPSGWGVPSIENWNTVTAFLGGETDAGYTMKSTFGWLENGHGTNASGFMALPGGYMDFDVWGSSTIFYDAGMLGGWWSSTPNGGQQAWHTEIVHDSNGMSTFFYRNRNSGWSVRCVKD